MIARGTPLAWALWLALSLGCSDQPSDKIKTGPGPQTEGLYGEPAGVPSQTVTRPLPSGPGDGAWTNAPFWFLQTELSPAVLYHSRTKYLGFFTQMGNYGLGAPAYAAFSTRQGPRSFKNGAAMDPGGMEENWLIVWFHGAKGWTNWDSPWALFLQHRPLTMNLDQNGLHLTFGGPSGDVALMPLYGYEKLPLRTNDFLAAHGLPEKKVRTWLWSHALPRELLMRVRYWAGATREFPVYCEDSFSVDRSRDAVIVRQQFSWRSIHDDWNTKHLKLAPLSPPLAHASMDKPFPVQFSRPAMDYEYVTSYGPYLGVEGVDSFDSTFRVLQYVNETEALDLPDTQSPAVTWHALDRLRETARLKFKNPGAYQPEPGVSLENWIRALSYCEEGLRTNAFSGVRKYLTQELLATNRLLRGSYPAVAGRESRKTESPAAGAPGTLDNPAECRGTILETVWTYAHFSGDWELVRERWGHLRQLFLAPVETRWVGFGPDENAELGKQVAPCVAFARLAYKMGDIDSYNYGCYTLARELVHHHLKQRGAAYFRNHQPRHSMEFMGEEVFLTSLSKETDGWRMDGPTFPAHAGVRQFRQRWLDFHDWDAARFLREYYRDDLRRELNWLAKDPGMKEAVSGGNPALVPLRSLLLDEAPTQSAHFSGPGPESGPPSNEIAKCLAVLRTSHPTRYERLIPGGAPSPFVAGLEREERVPSVNLVQTVLSEAKDEMTGAATNTWPQATWPAWKTPSGARWTFGHVRPLLEGAPGAVKVVPLNWNTRAVTYANGRTDLSGRSAP